jgi:hypothetical protein
MLIVVDRRAVVAVGMLLASSCAGTPAGVEAPLRRFDIEQALVVYEARAPAPQTLARIAAAVLEAEALSGSARRSRAALAALASAGTHALSALRRLGRNRFDDDVRARALGLLARLHDADALATLAEVPADASTAWQAAAVETLSPEADRARLVELAEAPAVELRLAAVQRLVGAPPADELRFAAARIARHDPDHGVRRAALRVLGRHGVAAASELAERAGDAPDELRADVLAALAAVDYALAVRLADPWLTSDPSPSAIDGARVLLRAGRERAPAKALALLERALAHHDADLRARAAVALGALPAAAAAPLARARLEHESERSIRLLLALAAPGSAQGDGALRRLTTRDDVVAAQAALELARRAGAQAQDASARVLALAESERTVVRAIVVGPLAGELGRAHEVRRALLDREPRVRVAAAVGMLGS